MKKKIAVLLLLAFVLSTFNIDQVQASQKDNGKGVTNEDIKDIIENPEKYSTDAMSQKEVEKFLDSKNPNILIGKTKEEIARYFATVDTNCGRYWENQEISDPIDYLHNTVGNKTDKYTVTKKNLLSCVGARTCSSFNDKNNCTLVSLYNMMVCYRDKMGYSQIPYSADKVYNVIKKQGKAVGYTPAKGTPVSKIEDLVNNTWQKGFNYKGAYCENNYIWTQEQAIKSIDNGYPFMFSFASGYYFNHTVTVWGYKIYKNNRTKKSYTFLMLRDGWSISARYVPWTGTDANYLGCMTEILPPGKF